MSYFPFIFSSPLSLFFSLYACLSTRRTDLNYPAPPVVESFNSYLGHLHLRAFASVCHFSLSLFLQLEYYFSTNDSHINSSINPLCIKIINIDEALHADVYGEKILIKMSLPFFHLIVLGKLPIDQIYRENVIRCFESVKILLMDHTWAGWSEQVNHFFSLSLSLSLELYHATRNNLYSVNAVHFVLQLIARMKQTTLCVHSCSVYFICKKAHLKAESIGHGDKQTRITINMQAEGNVNAFNLMLQVFQTVQNEWDLSYVCLETTWRRERRMYMVSVEKSNGHLKALLRLTIYSGRPVQ